MNSFRRHMGSPLPSDDDEGLPFSVPKPPACFGNVGGSRSTSDNAFRSTQGQRQRSESPTFNIGNTWQSELDEEDLAECISVWQERQDGQRATAADFPRSLFGVARARPGTGDSSSADALGPCLVLNVGGCLFRTTATTLRNAPFFDALLRNTAEGGLGATLDGNGHYFVDRSGNLFHYILEYLRTGHWLTGSKAADINFMEALRDESLFYGLEFHQLPAPRISEYVAIWQFRDDQALYVDCMEQTIREDPDHQGLFRLCKYSGGLPLDQQTCTKRFKATSHCIQSVIAYFGLRGFSMRHVFENSMITHVTSADGQSRTGLGTQFILSRSVPSPMHWQASQGGFRSSG
eukprot:TRINITY_DN57475_c0_g1_i1.p1 TRINITY_DN57475_c0_g1~~TRINITY_DN57475_c0_g1_i1.p1  ORF type:complete len:348 (-),score=49.98 TRINITY_DN57475_c0_g1_i1:51-1094(-)